MAQRSHSVGYFGHSRFTMYGERILQRYKLLPKGPHASGGSFQGTGNIFSEYVSCLLALSSFDKPPRTRSTQHPFTRGLTPFPCRLRPYRLSRSQE